MIETMIRNLLDDYRDLRSGGMNHDDTLAMLRDGSIAGPNTWAEFLARLAA